MNNYRTKEQIKDRLEELDRMETQIQFSASFLSADDHVRLNRIYEEQKDLKAMLEEET